MNPYLRMMETRQLNITVFCKWDAEARVWCAISKDLPGLVTEAGDLPALMQRVMDVAPELIEDNLADDGSGEDYLLNVTPIYQQMVRHTAR